MIVVEHLGPMTELVKLCAFFHMTPADGDLLLSQWLRNQKMGAHVELPESHTVRFLTNHIHGEL
jgi:hypothetical protein